jgi:hypothetical protein
MAQTQRLLTSNRYTIKLLVVLCALLFMPDVLYGEEQSPIDIRWAEAVDQDVSTAGMKRAARQALAEWTHEMDRYYAMLFDGLDEEKKLSLEKAQNDWKEYMQSEVAFFDDFYGFMHGSFFAILKVEKRAEMVRERALKLKFNYNLLEDEKSYECHPTTERH